MNLTRVVSSRLAAAARGDTQAFVLWCARERTLREAYDPKLHPRDRRGEFRDVPGLFSERGGYWKKGSASPPPTGGGWVTGPGGSVSKQGWMVRAAPQGGLWELPKGWAVYDPQGLFHSEWPTPEKARAAVDGELNGDSQHALQSKAMSAHPDRQERDQADRADVAAKHPLGSSVTTTVYSIGGRSEKVTGKVVDYRRRSVVVDANAQGYGRIVVPLDKLEAPEAKPDTPQQEAVLRQSPIARRVRERYPVGTRITTGKMDGTVLRHIPTGNSQGGHLHVRWDNGVEGNTNPINVRPTSLQ